MYHFFKHLLRQDSVAKAYCLTVLQPARVMYYDLISFAVHVHFFCLTYSNTTLAQEDALKNSEHQPYLLPK